MYLIIKNHNNILGIAVIHGEQKVEEESGREDGRQSPPTASLGVSYEFFPRIIYFKYNLSFF